jgi:hypothetical protein
VGEKFRVVEEPGGDILIFPKGDLSIAPSGRMPVGSAFFDTIVRQPPFDEGNLDPADNLEEFGATSDADLDHLARSVDWSNSTGRGVVATFGGTAFGDIALVPGPFMTNPKGIRDITEWYISTRSRRAFVHKIFERQCEIGIQNLARIHQRVGDTIQAVFVCGTDFGTQTSSFCSDATFRELWLPYYLQVNRWIHVNTTWKSFKHSCGSVVRFLDSFIDAGFDVLNPVQCSAKGMDPSALKSKYGDRLTFWCTSSMESSMVDRKRHRDAALMSIFVVCAAPLWATQRTTLSLDGQWEIVDSVQQDTLPTVYSHKAPIGRRADHTLHRARRAEYRGRLPPAGQSRGGERQARTQPAPSHHHVTVAPLGRAGGDTPHPNTPRPPPDSVSRNPDSSPGHSTTAHYNLHHSRAWSRNVDEQGFLHGCRYLTIITTRPRILCDPGMEWLAPVPVCTWSADHPDRWVGWEWLM